MKPIAGNGRRSFRAAAAAVLDFTTTASDIGASAALKSPTSLFWPGLHLLCCIISLFLGFRFSHLLFFLLFAPAVLKSTTTTTTVTNTTTTTTTTFTMPMISSPPPPAAAINHTASRVVVGRHGILIRPWPHPNPSEVTRAHRIIERVQKEQRTAAIAGRPRRPVIAVTPTHARTFQAPHLMGLVHTLMLLPYKLTWIVIEAGGLSNDTAAIIARSGVPVIHLPFDTPGALPPADRNSRNQLKSQMRLHALR